MAGISVPQYEIFKIGTNKLKYSNWNLTITKKEAFKYQELISLFEAQEFRIMANKILNKNISAGMLYDVNLGIRDYFTYTDAMLNNSLFSFYLQRNGLNIYRGKKDENKKSKNESARDIVCLDFDFGSRSYDDELKRLVKFLGYEIKEMYSEQ